jgi:hypothetical protein
VLDNDRRRADADKNPLRKRRRDAEECDCGNEKKLFIHTCGFFLSMGEVNPLRLATAVAAHRLEPGQV